MTSGFDSIRPSLVPEHVKKLQKQVVFEKTRYFSGKFMGKTKYFSGNFILGPRKKGTLVVSLLHFFLAAEKSVKIWSA